jgi:hypothetical protein
MLQVIKMLSNDGDTSLVNLQDKYFGNTPLHIALVCDCPFDVLSFLIDYAVAAHS